MQAVLEDFVDSAELEFCDQAASQTFGVDCKNVHSATPEIRRSAPFNSSTQKRTERGKSSFNNKKFGDQSRMDVRAVNGFVSVPRAARTQDGGPLKSLVSG